MPETYKLQAIIDKTALFISKQSGQMEIVLKTKQAGNPQFAFLTYDNHLNPYYKFILARIKEGVYNPVEEVNEEKEEQETKKEDTSDKSSDMDTSEDDDDDENSGELHPLLQAHRRPISTPAPSAPPPAPPALLKNTQPDKNLNKAPGKVEDLAKVYLNMRYQSNPEPEPTNNQANRKKQDDFVTSQQVFYDEHRPPPPPGSEVYQPQHLQRLPQHLQRLQRLPPPPPHQHQMHPNDIRLPPPVSHFAGPPPSRIPFQQVDYRIPQQYAHSSQAQLLPPGTDMHPFRGSNFLPPQMQFNRPPMNPSYPGIPIHPVRQPLESMPKPYMQPTHMPESAIPSSFGPPGVDGGSPLMSLPPPPPLPPPPSIEEIKKMKVQKLVSEEQAVEKEGEVENVQTEPETDINNRPHTEGNNINDFETETNKSDLPVIKKSARYEPSPLLSKILSRTTSKIESDKESPCRTFDNNSPYYEEKIPDRYETDSPIYGEETSRLQTYRNNSSYGENDSRLDTHRSNSPYNDGDSGSDRHYDSTPLRRNYSEHSIQHSPKRINLYGDYEQPGSSPRTEQQFESSNNRLTSDNSNYETFNQQPIYMEPVPSVNPFDLIAKTLQTIQNVESRSTVPTTTIQEVPLEKKQEPSNEIVPPSPDLQPVVDRLALYVAKNGDEFECGIKIKGDPRFDFLNPWNMYHAYYSHRKKVFVEELEEKKIEDEERRKNLKVSFGLKTKIKPVVANKQKGKLNTAAIFNQHDDEEHNDVDENDLFRKKDGFQPNKDIEKEMKKKLEKQIEEKERLLRQLHEQATLQEKINEVNRQASGNTLQSSSKTTTPQQQAHLKRKIQTENFKNDSNTKTVQDERRKKAASFVGMLKKAKGLEEDTNKKEVENVSSSFLRKRQFKETSDSEDVPEKISSEKKDAFFQAINQAFTG